MLKRLLSAILFPLLILTLTAVGDKPSVSLEEALENLVEPPEWMNSVEVDYDTNKPWKDARLEVRRLLAEKKYKEGMKLTYIYAQKNDIGDGHELPMYMFMGGELVWAVKLYREFLEKHPAGNTHAYLSLASCYMHFGEYDKALETMNRALQNLPAPPWRIANEANVHSYMGDLFAEIGQPDKARAHYLKAIELYPKSDQPYGRHLLHRRADMVRTKLDLLERRSVLNSKLRDGVYSGKSLGYGGDLIANVEIKNGRIERIDLNHKEKIELNATQIIPRRVIEKQSLEVDAVTGATVTSHAIIDAVYQALRQSAGK